jgi:TrmH family RNA methyltransferase
LALSATDIKEIKALHQKKFRRERGLFIVEGLKTIRRLLDSNYLTRAIYSTVDLSLIETDRETTLIKQKELERISSLKNPDTVLAIAEIPDQKPINLDDSLILVLDGIRDPGNLGTIIRTAKWFGINTIICSEDCADLYNPKVVQSTMGALFHVTVKYQTLSESIKKLKENEFIIAGAVMRGKSVYDTEKPNNLALVMGSESHGISPPIIDLCDQLITIPNKEVDQRVESLNAAIATSILLSEFAR